MGSCEICDAGRWSSCRRSARGRFVSDDLALFVEAGISDAIHERIEKRRAKGEWPSRPAAGDMEWPGVDQRVQRALRSAAGHVDLQSLLTTADRAEVGHRPVRSALHPSSSGRSRPARPGREAAPNMWPSRPRAGRRGERLSCAPRARSRPGLLRPGHEGCGGAPSVEDRAAALGQRGIDPAAVVLPLPDGLHLPGFGVVHGGKLRTGDRDEAIRIAADQVARRDDHAVQ